MKAIRILPCTRPQIIDEDINANSMRELLGPELEILYPFDDLVALVITANANAKHLPLNRVLWDGNEIYDVIRGSFFIVGINDDCDFVDLTDEQVTLYANQIFAEPEHFAYKDGNLMCHTTKGWFPTHFNNRRD